MKTIDEIKAKVAQEINAVTYGQVNAKTESDFDSHLIDDLGLDSLDYAAIMVTVEDWLEIRVPEANVNWAELQTGNLLSEFLHGLQKK